MARYGELNIEQGKGSNNRAGKVRGKWEGRMEEGVWGRINKAKDMKKP